MPRIIAGLLLSLGLLLASSAPAADPDAPEKPAKPADAIIKKIEGGNIELLKGDKPGEPQKIDIKPAKPQAKVSDAARARLDALAKAYRELKSLSLAGSLSMESDVAGQAESRRNEFSGEFSAPNRFRHEMKGDMLLVSDGKTITAFRPQRNDYRSAAAPENRSGADKFPQPARRLLELQNISLFCALVDDASKLLVEDTEEVSLEKDASVDNKTCNVLRFKSKSQNYDVLIDPASNLIRRIVIDLKPLAESRGQSDTRKLQLTYDYTTVQPEAKIADAQFAFTPPAGARESVASAAAAAADEPNALAGKQAPDFTLNGLDGKAVSLAEFKGKVVILDFWATWCGPCMQALPGLNKIYQDLQPKGLVVLALDQQEAKDKVQAVVNRLGLKFTVLLDEKAEVGEKYAVQGIPQTVVIGKDGKVRKVFIGSGNDERIRAAAEAALGE